MDRCRPNEEPVFVTVNNDLPVCSDISEETEMTFKDFSDNPYSP